MNPEFEKYVPEIIQLHIQGIGERLCWRDMPSDWKGLKKSDLRSIKLKLIDLGVIANDPPDSTEYTRLINRNFTFEEYYKNLDSEKSKKWYETEMARLQYEDYPNVKKRANRAILISVISVLVTLVLGYLKLKGQ